jgi:hypothetical protein
LGSITEITAAHNWQPLHLDQQTWLRRLIERPSPRPIRDPQRSIVDVAVPYARRGLI